MKRIKAACIQQTLHFLLKEDIDHDLAVAGVQEEVERYKRLLDTGGFDTFHSGAPFRKISDWIRENAHFQSHSHHITYSLEISNTFSI